MCLRAQRYERLRRAYGSDFRVQGFGFRASGSGLRVQDSRVWVEDLGFRVVGLEPRVESVWAVEVTRKGS